MMKFLDNYLFNPLSYIILYLFLAITTLHLEIDFLKQIHLERFTILAILGLGTIDLVFKRKLSWNWNEPFFQGLLLSLLIIAAPVATSLVNWDYLEIFSNPEYKEMAKILLLSPFLILYSKRTNQTKLLLDLVLFFYLIFGMYFLYRYLILGEVREFDLRPTLNIRHGDPNFLSAFFAMVFPLAFMRGVQKLKDNLRFSAAYNFFLGSFFILCSFMTESRMGILSILVTLAYLTIATLKYVKFRWHLVVGSLMVVLIVLVQGNSLLDRFSQMEDKSNVDRVKTFRNGFMLVADNPFFGVGYHQAKNSFFKNTGYPLFQTEFKQLEVHSAPLEILAELGLFGLVTFVLLFSWAFSLAFKLDRIEKHFLMGSLICLFLAGSVVGLAYKDLTILQVFIVAMIALSLEAKKSSSQPLPG